MKKFGIILLLVIFAITSFAASNKIVIWCSEKQADFIKTYGEKFTRDTGILVEVQQVNFGDIKSKFLTAAQAGEGPDIIIGAHDWVGELAANGLIDSIPFSAIETDKFAKSGLDAFTVNGKLYGVPYAIEAVALLYNKDYVEEPPKTIEELKELAAEYTTDETLGLVYDAGNFYFSYGFIAGNGGYVFKWTKENGYDTTDIGLANEGAVKGAELIKSFFDEGLIPQGANYGTMDSMFKDGLAAMIINGPWAVKDYINAGIDFGVLPLTELELSDGHYGKPFVGVQGLMINARSENKALAKEFVINYLATKEGVYQFYLADPRLPARTDVAAIIEEKGGPVPKEIVDGFVKSAAGGEPMPNVPEMGAVWGPMGDALSQIINGQAEPAQALKEAVEKIKTALNK
ncbi:maltose-binding periplasmic protein [Marinitoga piezophila KA3]|uniref:Maltose-binding periplasmic protein n=1 Tax=Marinitoga piezophila (strain DSM 14283 / JCM 11233 / KA3) TaxID=443254 RepID=H2J3U6_MARPK|nr:MULTISPECIES: maltose/maltodextrin ABC transporter substrate-binding protein MalE [Marinitoga]AEX85838.1 maltose-binding periplasmic protein [Marinitoga piezophila KA3]APT76278.1 sugar ABC transporter substrate-binding protein [Marinitoga sp. 1137]NUU97954.1 sugar ABC transporter substrate-binding protein [Marinitoga sp. 1138]